MSNEKMKLELERLKKELEKVLISTCVAPPSVQTAQAKKELVKSMGQYRTERLKSTSTTYISNFQSSAKGTWVSKVQTTFEQTSTKLNKLTS
jgi:DNA polymerase I-like protein with 3'-5' exonuclease and polymerase domains